MISASVKKMKKFTVLSVLSLYFTVTNIFRRSCQTYTRIQHFNSVMLMLAGLASLIQLAVM